MEKPTILLLASRLGMGGAERHTITLANLLSSRFRVVLAYLKHDEEMIGHVQRERVAGLHCLHARPGLDWRAVSALAQLATRYGVGAVVCANAYALMYAQLARFALDVPWEVIEVYHTTKLQTWKQRLSMLVYAPFFWLADDLVFVCETQRRYWLRRGLWCRRVHAIHNGVDIDHFRALSPAEALIARRAFGFSEGDRVVGICAVLRPEKAHTDLLEAVAGLHVVGQYWKVLIVGDGPLRAVVEDRIRTLGLEGDVVITGYQSDVRNAIAASDVVTLVSTTEAFSIATLEGMAMGKGLVMSDVGGAREQVTEGVNGYLFPPADVGELADRLSRCWDRAMQAAMGNASRARVEADFSQQRMVERYTDLLEKALRRGEAAAARLPDAR